jgi:hypothetical protein
VPVTAKLSSKFYERLGDDVAAELVDWFNAVDYTYQTQLKETNELNWERFKAELLAQGASIRGELSAESASIRGELRAESASIRGELHSEIASVRGEMKSGFSALSEELHRAVEQVQKDLQRWMFIYWCGSVVSLGGFLVGLLTLTR